MLLESAGLKPIVESADIDERHHDGEPPIEYAERMAREKAHRAAQAHYGEDVFVIAADTIVVHNGRILGKPADSADAFRMLKSLCADAHTVMTGVCVIDVKRQCTRAFVGQTHVHFSDVSESRLRAYIATGEPMDKAGAYGIQGGAAAFVSHIEGSYTNVVGLPLCESVHALDNLGFMV